MSAGSFLRCAPHPVHRPPHSLVPRESAAASRGEAASATWEGLFERWGEEGPAKNIGRLAWRAAPGYQGSASRGLVGRLGNENEETLLSAAQLDKEEDLLRI